MRYLRALAPALATALSLAVVQQARSAESLQQEKVLVHVDWKEGIPKEVEVEARSSGLEILKESDGQSAIKASILRGANYSGVANGSPRAEVQFSNQFRFQQGSSYRVRWSTYIPQEFEIDEKKFIIFTQVHQGDRSGPPTLALTILGENYAISQRGGDNPQQISAGKKFCCVSNDIGKWVNWKMDYTPSDSGAGSLTKLWKDGVEIFEATGKSNTYKGDNEAYIKFGLYKPHWTEESSTNEKVSMLFGPITISQGK